MENWSSRRTRELTPEIARGMVANKIGCARISMMVRSTSSKWSTSSKARPDTLMQDRTPGSPFSLATHGGSIHFGGNPGLNVWGVSFTSLEQRGIPLYRSACARKPPPPFRADKFQSLNARRLVQQTGMCPGNPLAYPQHSLESFDFS